MTIGGVSIILIGGIVNLLLVLWQLFTGKRWIKVKTAVHRRTGVLLVVTAVLHGFLGIAARLL